MSGPELRLLLVDTDRACTDRMQRVRDLLDGGDGSGATPSVDVTQHTEDAIDALRRGVHDAVVVCGREGIADLDRLRLVAPRAAVVVLCDEGPDAGVPLHPADVGIQSTLDLTGLDRRSLELTLTLAVERHRLDLAERHAEALESLVGGRDPQTGLPCGERLLEQVDLLLADAIRFGRPLTILLVQSGDAPEVVAPAVLADLAGLLAGCLRTSDLLGRLDDATFLVAMPGTGASAALQAVERIRAACTGSVPAPRMGSASLSGLMSVDEIVFRAGQVLAGRQAEDRVEGGAPERAGRARSAVGARLSEPAR